MTEKVTACGIKNYLKNRVNILALLYVVIRVTQSIYFNMVVTFLVLLYKQDKILFSRLDLNRVCVI